MYRTIENLHLADLFGCQSLLPLLMLSKDRLPAIYLYIYIYIYIYIFLRVASVEIAIIMMRTRVRVTSAIAIDGSIKGREKPNRAPLSVPRKSGSLTMSLFGYLRAG